MTIDVIKPSGGWPKLRVPWVSLLALVGVASLYLAFQDSRRVWTVGVWALSAFATIVRRQRP